LNDGNSKFFQVFFHLFRYFSLLGILLAIPNLMFNFTAPSFIAAIMFV